MLKSYTKTSEKRNDYDSKDGLGVEFIAYENELILSYYDQKI